MKSRIIISLVIFSIFLIAVPQALALDIQVDQQGVIKFYENNVLGKNTTGSSPTAARQAIKTIPSYADKTINIRPTTDATEVRILEKSLAPAPRGTGFDSTESMEMDSLRMDFPAQLTPDQIKVAKEKRAKVTEARAEKIDQKNESLQEKQQSKEEYLQKLQTQRQERNQEMIEVRNKIKNGDQELQLKSRQATASLKNGAEFNLDPKTNEVIVTTPSGEEHVLNHLPDQAIDQMVENGFFIPEAELGQELEVKVYDNGDLYYHKPGKINKRLFGFIPFKVDSEIVLNDNTGEVVEKELAADTIFEQFFNAVSF